MLFEGDDSKEDVEMKEPVELSEADIEAKIKAQEVKKAEAAMLAHYEEKL
jgi:hypothetical protein